MSFGALDLQRRTVPEDQMTVPLNVVDYGQTFTWNGPICAACGAYYLGNHVCVGGGTYYPALVVEDLQKRVEALEAEIKKCKKKKD